MILLLLPLIYFFAPRADPSSSVATSLTAAYEEIKGTIMSGVNGIESMSADGLMLAVEKLAGGGAVSIEQDYPTLQLEVEKAEAQRQVQRVIQQQAENEKQLDISLKVEQAKKQQLLQKRLLAKSKASSK